MDEQLALKCLTKLPFRLCWHFSRAWAMSMPHLGHVIIVSLLQWSGIAQYCAVYRCCMLLCRQGLHLTLRVGWRTWPAPELHLYKNDPGWLIVTLVLDRVKIWDQTHGWARLANCPSPNPPTNDSILEPKPLSSIKLVQPGALGGAGLIESCSQVFCLMIKRKRESLDTFASRPLHNFNALHSKIDRCIFSLSHDF